MDLVDGFHRLGSSSFYKEHLDAAGASAVFVANVPAFSAEAALRATFHEFGTIVRVDVDLAVPYRTRCAKVFWAEADAARGALRASRRLAWPPLTASSDEAGAAAGDGLKRLVAAHQSALLPTASLLAAADKAMAIFEKAEASESARRAADRSDGPDADGFTTVVHKRKGSRGLDGSEDAADGSGGLLSAQQQKKRKKAGKALELKNFYRHQLRAEKTDQLAELRERFKEDKARIAKLKEARVFKAF
jgi:ribosomal RNA-processing protein 7